jgi:hypothetical protein
VTHIDTTTVPDIWFKSQRIIRSLLAAVIVFVPIANASLPPLAEAFNASDVPAEVYLWVNGVIAAALAVLGILTRIMAIPAVNAFLTKFGAGSVPKSAVTP